MALLLLLLLPPLTLANDPVLLFSPGSFFQFTVGIAMPIVMNKRGGLSATVGYQFNYLLPTNVSQLEPTIVHARSSRQVNQQQSLQLSDIYLSLEGMLDRYGWGDARQCMLRTICELAEVPLDRTADTDADDYHVIEQMIHLLLTPSEDGQSEGDTMGLYHQAETLGRREKAECATAYEGCRGSLLDSFTELSSPPKLSAASALPPR